MAELAYGSGLRLMELLRLRVKDVDLDRRQVVVRGGKGDKDRVTVLFAGRDVSAFREARGAAGAPEQESDAACAASLCRDRHSRHAFASHLLLADYDLQTIRKLLGHSDIKTTMIYLQTVPGVTLKDAKSPLDLDPTLG